MQLLVNAFGEFPADAFDLCEFLDAGRKDFPETTKTSQQALPALDANSFDVFQG